MSEIFHPTEVKTEFSKKIVFLNSLVELIFHIGKNCAIGDEGISHLSSNISKNLKILMRLDIRVERNGNYISN